MESFIDTLGRLTKEQLARIQEEARIRELEQQRLAREELDRLYAQYLVREKERRLLELQYTERQKTLSMAWLGAEFLKAAEIPMQNWLTREPVYTTKGLFNKRSVVTSNQERFAFDAWRLETIESESKVQPDFYAKGQKDLVLTGDGDVGVATNRIHIDGKPATFLQYRIGQINNRISITQMRANSAQRLSPAQIDALEAEYLASSELRETSSLTLFTRDSNGEAEEQALKVLKGRALERLDGTFNRLTAPIDLLPDGIFGDRFENFVTLAISNVYEKQVEKVEQSVKLDDYIRHSVANLLALHDIEVI